MVHGHIDMALIRRESGGEFNYKYLMLETLWKHFKEIFVQVEKLSKRERGRDSHVD